MNPLIETVNLSVQYDKVKALNNVNIQLPQNKKIAIIGPNGAGKSTFIKACLGLIAYDGQVTVLNQTIKESRQQIAYVPQRSNVNWYFPTTVEDVVKMGVSSNRFIFSPISKEKKDKVEQALAIMKLTDLKDRQTNQLSGGQKQRVFLARAIAQDARLIF
ncbi:metal ABC transporter ATP-binding protein [Globicatella sulfidifaciens]